MACSGVSGMPGSRASIWPSFAVLRFCHFLYASMAMLRPPVSAMFSPSVIFPGTCRRQSDAVYCYTCALQCTLCRWSPENAGSFLQFVINSIGFSYKHIWLMSNACPALPSLNSPQRKDSLNLLTLKITPNDKFLMCFETEQIPVCARLIIVHLPTYGETIFDYHRHLP